MKKPAITTPLRLQITHQTLVQAIEAFINQQLQGHAPRIAVHHCSVDSDSHVVTLHCTAHHRA